MIGNEKIVGATMPVVPERSTPAHSPLSFTLSRGRDCAIVVDEAHGHAGGSFPDLSSALRFVETQCEAYGCPVQTRFDASLALIRAAGA